jgi:molecular chaperone GrpE
MSLDNAKSAMRNALLSAEDYRSQCEMQRDLYVLEQYTESSAVASIDPKIKELEDIAKNAQYSYIMLKSEFDSLVRRTENDGKESKVNQLIDLAKKLTPIIDQLGQTVAHIPTELTDNTWAAGVKLVYDNAIKTLATLGITLIPTIGEEPDMELHEPLSVEPTNEESLKGKITQEFQPGYVYEKDGIKKVITAAKVIVGQ